ncbi:hypothetical protein DL96DRAFT_1704619 [Flagelloscypha sp. PMI_526]|nr:hypothetical protein DL96DRAFT_1704619 [Flagelloscypha sp. PMI_526]
MDLLDTDINRYEELLRKLKARRNAVSPACNLPFDILANCFLWLKDDAVVGREVWSASLLGPPSPPAVRPTPAIWAFPSMVCRNWRSVALECATLWDILHLDSVFWTERLLERSKQAELTVVFDNFTSTVAFNGTVLPIVEESFYKAMTQSHRIKEIVFSTRTPGVETRLLMACLLRAPFPILQRVRLPDIDAGNMLPGLAADMTNLLGRNSFYWEAWADIRSDSLTTLNLSHTAGFSYPTFDIIAQMLEGLPSLQDLSLTRILPKGWYGMHTPVVEPIVLPMLRRISLLFLTMLDSAMFLSQFEFDPQIQIRLLCADQFRHKEEILGDMETLVTVLDPYMLPPPSFKGKERQPAQYRAAVVLATDSCARLSMTHKSNICFTHDQTDMPYDPFFPDQRISPFSAPWSYQAMEAQLDIGIGPSHWYGLLPHPALDLLAYSHAAFEALESLAVLNDGMGQFQTVDDWLQISEWLPNLKTLDLSLTWDSYRQFIMAFDTILEDEKTSFSSLEALIIRRSKTSFYHDEVPRVHSVQDTLRSPRRYVHGPATRSEVGGETETETESVVDEEEDSIAVTQLPQRGRAERPSRLSRQITTLSSPQPQPDSESSDEDDTRHHHHHPPPQGPIGHVEMSPSTSPSRSASPAQITSVTYAIPSLRTVLGRRRERGSFIALLCLYDCYFLTPSVVAALDELVGVVDWDGKFGPSWDVSAHHWPCPGF